MPPPDPSDLRGFRLFVGGPRRPCGSTAGVVSTGSNAQGQTGGTLYWKIPANISGNYAYQCTSHSAMRGTITIKQISAI